MVAIASALCCASVSPSLRGGGAAAATGVNGRQQRRAVGSAARTRAGQPAFTAGAAVYDRVTPVANGQRIVVMAGPHKGAEGSTVHKVGTGTFQQPGSEPLGEDYGRGEMRMLVTAHVSTAGAIRQATSNANPVVADLHLFRGHRGLVWEQQGRLQRPSPTPAHLAVPRRVLGASFVNGEGQSEELGDAAGPHWNHAVPAGGAAAPAGDPTQRQRVVRRSDIAVFVLSFCLQLLLWRRVSPSLESRGHVHQAMYMTLCLVSLLLAVALPLPVWLKYRVLVITVVRTTVALVPAQSSTSEGTALLAMHRPPSPGWLGALLDWMRVLLGMRILSSLGVAIFLIQPPLALLAQQLLKVCLASNNLGYCATPLLSHPLSRQRLSFAWRIFESTPTVFPVPDLPAPQGQDASKRECVAVLAMVQAMLLVLVPLVAAAHLSAALLPPAPPPSTPQQRRRSGGQRGGWRHVVSAAAAGAGQVWDQADRELSELCTGEGYACLHLAIAAWLLTGILWLLCKASAYQQLM